MKDTLIPVDCSPLLDCASDAPHASFIMHRHYSYRTEQTYLHWIKQFILLHHKQHPSVLGASDISAFLTHLAVKQNVSASTQNQVLAAVLFLYRYVLEIDLPRVENVERAKKPTRLPVVFTREEVKALLSNLSHTKWLMASLRLWSGNKVKRMPGAAREGYRFWGGRSVRSPLDQ
jgi:site-specific recombinase XerD